MNSQPVSVVPPTVSSLEPLAIEDDQVLAAWHATGMAGENPAVAEHFTGAQYHVFKIEFSDHPSVAVRVRHPLNEVNKEEAIDLARKEFLTFEKLAEKQFPYAPGCHGACLDFDNPIKYPFIITSWIEGRPLLWSKDYPAPAYRGRVLRQVASVQLALLNATMERFPISAHDFFKKQIRNRRRRIRHNYIPGLTERDCDDQEDLLGQVLGPDLDSPLFAMDHGNMKTDHIIVDQYFDVQGIIDWSSAQMAPLAKAASLPTFLRPDDTFRHPPRIIDLNDRQAYIRVVNRQNSLSSSAMMRWQGCNAVDFRNLYIASFANTDTHLNLASVEWKLPYCEYLWDEAGEASEDVYPDPEDRRTCIRRLGELYS